MDNSSNAKLIKDTFKKPFDKGHFSQFVKNLLNTLDPSTFVYRGNYIPDSYKPYIDTFERVGKYTDPQGNKIDVLIVNLKKSTSLEHARTMQRNFIGSYLNGSRGGELKDAALVAFVSPNPEDWRFSLVKMEYKLDTSGDKVKAQEELTPARRSSFLVGAHEDTHTAQSQLKPILEEDLHNPTLKQLEDSFSIEKVTKEFFKKYRELFLKINESLKEVVEKDQKVRDDFIQKNVDNADFTKKLLGQIVFLYFLQKKGWFGVARDSDWGTGSKRFLRELFEKNHAGYKNFFNDILEPLFYNTLAIERSNDYSDKFNCKIPFLNGGLFDPINNYDWLHTDIVLDNEIFSNDLKTKEGDTGTGILDVLDRYNFTVKEDEPLEKEVAVDPEMLGKVFENLLEVKDRKSKGTYYTPREIVHYMCQESLTNYLATKLEGRVRKEDLETLIKFGETAVEHDTIVQNHGKQTPTYSFKLPESIRINAQAIDGCLSEIKVCDPAVGSGAFLVGMMNEIVRTRDTLTSYLSSKTDRTLYDFKREAIQNSLYGVDIDPGAVEIAKLRLWLSLVVDEEDIKQIKPLPNLDYKIMQGNSLIELISPKFLAGRGDSTRKGMIERFNKEKEELFEVTSPSQKQKKREELNALIREIFQYDQKKGSEILKQRISNIKSQQRLFEDKEVEREDRRKVRELEEKSRDFAVIKVTGARDHFEWHINFNEVFENDGFDVVIANPPYIRIHKQEQNENIKEVIKRTYISAYKDFDYYVLFIEKGIHILKQDGVLTYITPDKYLVREYGSKIRGLILEYSIVELFDLSRSTDIFEAATYPLISIIQKNNSLNKISIKIASSIRNLNEHYKEIVISKQGCIDNDRIEIIDPEANKILTKIFSQSNKISDILDKGQLFSGTPRAKDYYSWAKHISSDKKAHNCLRILVCSNLEPYSITHKKKVRTVGLSVYSPYFYNESNVISETRWKAFLHTPKILIRGTDTRITAVLDEEGSVFIGIYGIKIYGQIANDYKYLLALLNSSLYQWVFSVQNPSIKIGGGFFSINAPHILRLPFKKVSSDEHGDFNKIVDEILSLTREGANSRDATVKTKVREYENQIDQLVYNLYGLTPEEIEVVKNSLNDR